MTEPNAQSGSPCETTPDGLPLRIYTAGYGALTVDAFLELLRRYGIERVVDVRGTPVSRHAPHFDKKRLSPFLRIRGIKYLHLKELAAMRRHVKEGSPNDGWRNASLRGFADYMPTPAFVSALARLVLLARGKRTAIVCAEGAPWRCHRLLIADALTVQGMEVVHILSAASAMPHALTPIAEVTGTRITYPAPATE